MLIRERLENAEVRNLAGYATKSVDTRGRRYPDEEHPYRTAFQRDRDRIIHTTAFRRLEYKTQVFVNTEGDYYRTRLTHTVEAAQIARTLARALFCNEDLAEGIALAHDLGHAPFGHSGEETMAELMSEYGGFNHNTQTLRIVEELEERYDDYAGLNLTWEFREGIIKHETAYDRSDAANYDPDLQPSLEAQLVNFADEIAYTTHDLDDGLRAGLLEASDLKAVALWNEAVETIHPAGEFTDIDRHRLIRHLVDTLATDVVNQTRSCLEQQHLSSVEDIRRLPAKVASYSPAMSAKQTELREFLFGNLYRNYRVMRMSFKARHILVSIFRAYCESPAVMATSFQRRLATTPLQRVVCDYIAGMTDRFAMQEYQRLFDPVERV